VKKGDRHSERVSDGLSEVVLVAGEGGGEGEEAEEVAGFAFPSRGQAAVVAEPGETALDDPPVTAQSLRGLDTLSGDLGGDAALAEPSAQVVVVVALVRVELRRFPATGPAAGCDVGYRLHQGDECVAVVGVGGAECDGEGQSVGVGQQVEFAAALAPVDRVWPGVVAPFFARREAASTTVRDQSSMPSSPSRSSTARCSRRHNPARVHCPYRRCTVCHETPKTGGSFRHGHPVTSTNTIAANTASSSDRALPPPCQRTAGPSINGSATSHSSAGTNHAKRSLTHP
jgi:hypothetical protein